MALIVLPGRVTALVGPERSFSGPDRGALGGTARGMAIVDGDGVVCKCGRATIGLPCSVGCLALAVVAIAVESFRLSQIALGEVLPGLGKARARGGGGGETEDSECSEHEDSTADGNVSEECFRSSSLCSGGSSEGEHKKKSIPSISSVWVNRFKGTVTRPQDWI